MALLPSVPGVALLSLVLALGSAHAADKVTFLTSWYAQAEHGGFYQAKAAGLYDKAGLDVTIKMGGPQVNGLQLLLAGEADVMMGYDFQVLTSLSKGLPVVTIATSFQKDLQGLMAHDAGQEASTTSRTRRSSSPRRAAPRWWPWLRRKYGYTDAQTQPYTFNLQPFFNDKNVVQQSYPSSEPFQAHAEERPGQVLPVRRQRLPALWHHHGRQPPSWWRSGRTSRAAS